MIALAPSSRSRTPTITSDAERGAAATRGLYIRVLELEARTLQTFDVIDLRADQVHEAHLVDHALHALDLELTVDLGRLVEIQVIGEAGAAAAHHPQPQGMVRLDPLGRADLVDLAGRDRGDT